MRNGEKRQNKDEAIQTLMNLGLTYCQSKIYLSLVQNANCTAKMISQISKVPRQEIYRIMPLLEEKGLVRRIFGTPIEWEATPIKDGLSILMDVQKENLLELQRKTIDLVDNFKVFEKRRLPKTKEPEFLMIPRGQQQRNFLKEKLENLQTSFDGFTEFKGLDHAIFFFGKYFKKPLARGVNFRTLFFNSEDKIKELVDLEASFGYANVQNKFISKPSKLIGMVLDKQEICIYTSVSTGMLDANLLWSKNPIFVELLKDYFELLWNSAEHS